MPLADLVLLNGKIVSMDSKDQVFEAIAAHRGKIVAVGSTEKISELIGNETHVVHLRGKTVTPGLIDAHSHLALAGVNKLTSLDLAHPEPRSIMEVLGRISERISQANRGEWIVGGGWDEAMLEEKRPITRWDLDPLSRENPVILLHASGHSLVANTLALKLAGVEDPTLDTRGFIVVDKNRGMTGLLKESVMDLVLSRIPPFNVKQLEDGIKIAQEDWLRDGITANKDPGLYGDSSSMVQAYRSLLSKGELKIRSCLLYKVDTLEDVQRAAQLAADATSFSDMLRVVGIKIFLDGASRIRTAWMYDEWNLGYFQTDVGNRGHPVIDLSLFRKIVQEAHRRGLQVCIHAVGDHAVDVALDSIDAALAKYPRQDHRHSMIHCIVPTAHALARMKTLGIVVETQSSFIYFFGDILAGNLGPRRCWRAIPLKSYMKAGITVGNSADADFYPHPPKFGIYAACTRKPMKRLYGDEPFGTDECITVHEALRTYTSMAAKCLFWEDSIGTVELGKHADLVVWSEDPYAVAPEKLKDLKVALTIVGGRISAQSGALSNNS